jgi:4,5-dihydroxyphthalate decarboxylase
LSELHFLLGDYPITHPFIESPRVADGTMPTMHSFAESGGARAAVARMVRELPGLDYDISELPLVNYISAKEHGAKFTAIPVVLTRRFENYGIWGDARQGVNEPKDLEGKRVGLLYHGHSDLVWMRGIMSDVHGVDLDSITWITANPETVGKAPLPPNVWQMPGCSFPALIDNGAIAGAVLPWTETFENPAVHRLVPDIATADRDWFEKTGIFPQLHTVVVKDAVLKARPQLATALFRALTAAKREAFARAAKGMSEQEVATTHVTGFLVSPVDRRNRPYLPADPLPYGLEANRKGFEMLVRFAREQKVTAWQPPIEDLFVSVDESEGT